MADQPAAFGSADLTNCDREQIHLPGSIQPHGALLAMEPAELKVVQAGGDTMGLLGARAEDLIGHSLAKWLTPKQTSDLRGLLSSIGSMSRPMLAFTMKVDDENRTTDAIAHISEGYLVLEFEPLQENNIPEDSLGLVQTMVRKVQQAQSVRDFCQIVVDEIRAASSFDRVMAYRFHADGSGSVEAEAKAPDLPPYLGLRYPATDIPQQARALYLRNWIRLIPNILYRPAPLLSSPDWPAGKLLDQSQCTLRSVSPIHVEYLSNMGVTASMSMSIIIDDKLWGLIACHNMSPRYLPYRLRVAFELFSQMASFQLQTKVAAEDYGVRLRSKAIHEALVVELAGKSDLADGLNRFRQKLLDFIPAAGVGLWLDGKFTSLGKTPKATEVAALVNWLNENMTEGVFSTEHLSSYFPKAAAFADVASGILAISVSRSPRDYLIWFRQEIIQVVTWAGNPDKRLNVSPDGLRLSPRRSFAQWRQQVRFQSEPWNSVDVKTAEALRASLMDVVVEHMDQLARQRERAKIQQDELIAQLDTRIKEWEAIAQELKLEGDRRAVLEAELAEVLRSTVTEQEAERQRIARELHDSLGQYLTVMRLDLDKIAYESDASPTIQERVERLKDMTAEAGREVNKLAWEVRPTALDDLGLQTAFEQFLEEWGERTNLQFDLHLALSGRRLAPSIETALYRVLQEAIRNVIKHAGAKRVGVILEANAKEVRFIVEDDGCGFPHDESKLGGKPSARLGLLGIRERIALVGGTLEIESSANGTTLIIHVPL
jgi:light-regulated signal transduction histidine kinase (bacteriophytochrome)